MSSKTAPASAPATRTKNPLRRLYYWVLDWGNHPMGGWALVVLAFCESSFFPIPPDVLLIALCLGARRKWARYAAACSVASVLGGMAGYALGLWLLEPVCLPLIDLLNLHSAFARASLWYREYDVWAVAAAGFSPIPYKVFTIAAGITRIDFIPFVLASLASRSARFFLVAWLLWAFGERAKTFVDKHLNWLAIALVVLGVLGFWAVGQMGGASSVKIDHEKCDRLVAELQSGDIETRKAADLELQQSTGHYAGFRPAADSEERARGIERWQEWLAERREADGER
ncbi:MAG: DedA family protein [Planctomycetes bacterium]|nr:DedA family protein [Planctomycetota bacterium]